MSEPEPDTGTPAAMVVDVQILDYGRKALTFIWGEKRRRVVVASHEDTPQMRKGIARALVSEDRRYRNEPIGRRDP